MTVSTPSFYKTTFIGFIAIIFSLHISYAQTKTEQLDELLSLYTEYGQFNGSVLVAEKGKVLYKKGFGFANMEWDILNQPNTKHRLGSITKQFTAMLIMQLVAEHKLELDSTVSKYLPEYPKANGDIITIHHLLTHTSGIPNYTAYPNFFKDVSRDPYSPKEFLSYLQIRPSSSSQVRPSIIAIQDIFYWERLLRKYLARLMKIFCKKKYSPRFK